jgi:hypothetical protein
MTDFTLVENDERSEINLQELRAKHALQYEREKTALKYYLIGRNFSKAIKALGFVERIEFRLKEEERFRKDKVTPSLHHQLRIALSVTQLCDLTPEQEELVIIAALLHDIMEDHGVSSEELISWFGKEVADIIWKLTKKFAGTHKSKEEYARDLAICCIAALVKGLDRLDNLCNMIGVFTIPKMVQYTDEAEKVFLPMLKTASKLYPELMRTFTGVSQQMKRQIKITQQYIKMHDDLDLKIKHRDDQIQVLETKSSTLEEDLFTLRQEGQDHGFRLVEGMTRDQKKKIFNQISSLLRLNTQVNNRQSVQNNSIILQGLTRILAISTLELQDFISEDLSPGTVSINVDTKETKEY